LVSNASTIFQEYESIFCDNLIDRKVDPDFEDQYKAAKGQGLEVGLISFEDLNDSSISKSVSMIKEAQTPELAVYRGWMTKPGKDSLLYEGLLRKNI
jgi:hypothetical protein